MDNYFQLFNNSFTRNYRISKKKNISVETSCKLIYTDEQRDNLTVHIKAKEDIENAKNVDVAKIFVKADSGEEYSIVENSIGDRENLDLWHDANELIDEVPQVNDNIIVVINALAVVNLPWLNKVKGIIFSGFPRGRIWTCNFRYFIWRSIS